MISPFSSPNRSIVHMDLDAFFVAVECLRDDRLKGIPLIIGGKNGKGVVTACSYEARSFGIHSAMPTKTAMMLCPQAKVISGDMDAYSHHSRLVTEVIASEAPLFEKSSIDEFYLDLSGMDKYFGTFQWACELRRKIRRETGLVASMGVSCNKLVSKVATSEHKPDGEKQVLPGDEKDFLGPLPVRKLPSIGTKTTQFLADMGIFDVQTLRQMPLSLLQKTLGKNGKSLWLKARGIDHTPITPYRERKSISTECTFHQDSIDVNHIKAMLTAMVEKLGQQLREQRHLTACVAIKIRYANFDTESKQKHVHYTSSDDTILQTVLSLFSKTYTRRMRLRLVGVRLTDLIHGSEQLNLFDNNDRSHLLQALDHIRTLHGPASIQRASTLGTDNRLRWSQNAFKG